MTYIIGIIALIGGFGIGQMVLFFLLRGVSRDDLLNDPYIKWKYGGLNWLIAITICYIVVQIYEYHF